MSAPARLLRAVARVLPGGTHLLRRLDAARAYDDLAVATDRAGVGLAWVDAEGRIRRGNREASRICGVAPENLGGLPIADLIPTAIADLIQRRDPEMITINRDGQRRTIAVEATRVMPARDGVVALLVVEDVTERVRSQELLQHQKHVLELMARSLPLNDILAGIVRLIEDQAPGALSTIYLVDAERRLRLGAAPSWPADFVAAVDGCAIGPQAGSCGAAAHFAKRMVSTDIAAGDDPCWGPYREWILSYGIKAAWSTPVIGADGTVLGTVSMCWREPRVPVARELELVDVATRLMAMAIERARGEAVATEQKARLLAAAGIDEHRRLLSSVLHSTSDGILVSDGQGRVSIGNRALWTMWRLEEPPAAGIDVPRFLQSVALQVDAQGIPRLEAAARSAGSQPVVIELRDGRAFECRVRPLQLASDGAPVGRVWTFRDISESRRLEAQLHFSERMASIGRLAAGVAHEINNPMTHVLCALELARQQAEAPDADRSAAETLADVGALIRDAHGSGLRVGRIVSELKNFSRNDGSDLAPLRVEDALEASIGIAISQIQHRARLERRYAPTPVAVGNENRLAQVFLNILINAVQALPVRPIDENRIVIVTGRDPSGRVLVEIRDNGIGMPPDVIQHAFEPFFTTKPVGSGTGLGLSICYAIVRALGGEITIESSPGHGTCVRVLLLASERPAAALATRTEVQAPIAASGPRRRLLVIDDEALILQVVSQFLAPGHDVVAASDAAQALALLLGDDAPPFDAILCDLHLPGMTGAELHARIAHERPGLERRFVFMTGGALNAGAQQFLASCANRVIDKPFALNEVARACLDPERGRSVA